jgi:hypothetical protein
VPAPFRKSSAFTSDRKRTNSRFFEKYRVQARGIRILPRGCVFGLCVLEKEFVTQESAGVELTF